MIFSTFKYGIKVGLGQWRTALIAYLFQLLIAVVLGMQVYQVIEASIGSSLEINKLVDGYDHTVISDFLNVHGASLSPLIGQLRYVILGFLIVSVFINAGLLGAVMEGKKGWKIFWKSGSDYFFPFFKIAVFFIVLTLIWSAILWIPFMGFFMKSTEVFRSEITTVFLLFALLGIYALGLVFFMVWSLTARLYFIKGEKMIWTVIKSGFSFAAGKYFSSSSLVLLFLLLQTLFFGLYLFSESHSGMVSPFLIIVFFIFQQFLVFSRWIFRIGIYAGMAQLVEKK